MMQNFPKLNSEFDSNEGIEINLTNWRLFDQKKFTLPKQSFLLTGNNGKGKTSFLMSVFALLTGNVFGGKLIQNLKTDSQYFGIETNKNWSLTGQIGTNSRLKVNFQKPNLIFPSSLSYLPNENSWFETGRISKLSILDNLLAQIYPKYASHLSKFNKSLKAKQKFLQDCTQNNSTGDQFLMHTLSQEIYQNSLVLWEFRGFFWQELFASLSDFEVWLETKITSWQIKWQVSNTQGIRQNVDYCTIIEPKNINWQGLWTKELTARQILFGAHRDDFEILANKTVIQNYFSRGEMRLFVLFIKSLAANIIKRNGDCWGFFDDVFGELDSQRERILLDNLLGKMDYFVATGTRPIPGFNNIYTLEDLEITG